MSRPAKVAITLNVDDTLARKIGNDVKVAMFGQETSIPAVIEHFDLEPHTVFAVIVDGVPLGHNWDSQTISELAAGGKQFLALTVIGLPSERTTPASTAKEMDSEDVNMQRDAPTTSSNPASGVSTPESDTKLSAADFRAMAISHSKFMRGQQARNVLRTREMNNWLKDRERVLNPEVQLLLQETTGRTAGSITVPVVTTAAEVYSTVSEAFGGVPVESFELRAGFPPKPVSRDETTLFDLGIKQRYKLYLHWAGPTVPVGGVDVPVAELSPQFGEARRPEYHSTMDVDWREMARTVRARDSPQPQQQRQPAAASQGPRRGGAPGKPKWMKL
ncbi:hypothetical protein J8273_7219 [Carpediemonas membranifera]|uniref:Uncharacterized protein n=1 Tax=Carpediemonas membranifera TaxID=201153 RepID=A0A8J6AQ45_9EUKA|nr:hypothetical protein J8273_7219 [Carpediemonas membranifera]|eukprot:KAG9390946.1 hypothetical protein J8273_7219 [Carpediemonas membranifera]